MAGATYLGADINKASIQKRLDSKYIDYMFETYEEARDYAICARDKGDAISIGVVMDAGDLLQRLLDDNIIPGYFIRPNFCTRSIKWLCTTRYFF